MRRFDSIYKISFEKSATTVLYLWVEKLPDHRMPTWDECLLSEVEYVMVLRCAHHNVGQPFRNIPGNLSGIRA